MIAEFKTDAGTTYRIKTAQRHVPTGPTGEQTVNTGEGIVVLDLAFPDSDHAHQATLKRSEARAIASALMGAAAEI